MESIQNKLLELKNKFEGELKVDELHIVMYSTDASVYRERPSGVAYPKSASDIKLLIQFANENKIPLLPRGAGTSLAGQVVGTGIVLDVSKYMNNILEINPDEKWVRIQPGVVLDELNIHLKKHNLFFSPETSTASRCTIGGMFGNNSCGSHSVIYGSTRDHILEASVILSDGSDAVFGKLDKDAFLQKCSGDKLENKIYREVHDILNDTSNQDEIIREYPLNEIRRRNNGYAIDQLLYCDLYEKGDEHFNFCKLLAGSEGTLAFTTEIKLNIVPLPPKYLGAVCAHFNSLEEAFEGNLVALDFKPGAVELIDDKILECTKHNKEQQKNRFFIQGDPKALLIIEFARETEEEINNIAAELEKKMREKGYGYYFPMIKGDELKRVWALRKAGLGLLSHIPGDKHSEDFIEDTAVRPVDLPAYMEEFKAILEKHNTDCVFYAHIGSGEIHLRPMLNLKDSHDVKLFHTITEEVAYLVKKYKGSLSGEHGDGRLRGEFIPIIIGQKNYELCKKMKNIWDPQNIFNPGKVVDTPKMNESLRYLIDTKPREIETVYDFSDLKGILRAAEKCNGSGDCRNSQLIGGTMCPSFKATRNEKDSTRARANVLREFLTRSTKANPFDHKEIYEAMELCISCKACKSECPSSVDVAKLKAEFLQHYYDSNGIPLRTRLVAYIAQLNKLASIMPGISNFFMKLPLLKIILNITPYRSLPSLSNKTFSKLLREQKEVFDSVPQPNGTVYLFNDEFTNYNESDLGIITIKLLTALGYRVKIAQHRESGRTFISKGLLRSAKKIAVQNVSMLSGIINGETPLVGIEPSAILSFRDEYLDLVGSDMLPKAKELAENTFTIDEFLASEIKKGKIKKSAFTTEKRLVKFHGHCQQKAIGSTATVKELLSFPENYTAEEYPSGCCGMAGSFGYEKEHYDVSMKIGELVLFPSVREENNDTIVSAAGTSCRHQIKDGTGRTALHTVEVLYNALIK